MAPPQSPALAWRDASSLRHASSAHTPLLSLKGVGKAYSTGVVALQNVDLTIRQGEFLSLLGPSGCGKSTVLRLIAGLGALSQGSVEWSEQERHAAQRGIGFVFQEPTLMPWATVFSNIYLPLKLRGVSKAEARPQIEHAIEQVGLAGFAKAYPRELSGGMRMRVSIARALIARPQIMLLDEPFAALDEITRFKLNDDLLRLWSDQKWTVVFVTHSVYESVYLSNRIVVMTARPGRVHADVSIEEPYPRDQNYRTSPLYNEYCRNVSNLLAEAMSK
jgi:NitT/TauT family transport system ATP-binding protein